ncbi:RING-H2 finger protein ATL2 [Heracleum sosnowskyi]|uniref:RING-H2 finger protein ATL2 n=1 Tax=Heracleum sosnowskyi TaxID=360622 RepID=A0AAD8M183_9APIA|nr:RING-H2 finger protein ATL2 [Heracleum sosnowskyi]
MDGKYAPHLTIEKTSTHVNNYTYSSKVMFISVIVLFVFSVSFAIFHIYSRFVLLRRSRDVLRHRLHHHRTSFTADSLLSSTQKGLAPSILNSLSTFIFAGQGNATLECAVCLSEFEKNETGRVLPECRHGFHLECIDMWFLSNSTCPLCRAPVQLCPVSGSDPGHNMPDTIIDVDPVGSGLRSNYSCSRMVYSSSSSSLPQLLNCASVNSGSGSDTRIGSDSRVRSKPMGGPVRSLTRLMSI